MDVLEFINGSPTPYHAVFNVCRKLSENGYKELSECSDWDIEWGGKYFVTRSNSSVIAFNIPMCDYTGINVCASHTDSPSFKIKSNPVLKPVNGLIRLNVEGYGGMIRESWFDRPLSVAGRVAVAEDGRVVTKLVNIEKDIMIIPSLAVHMGKARGEGEKINIQNEMLPILCTDAEQDSFLELIAESADVDKENIYGCDLYLYNSEKGVVLGLKDEFIASGRIDNLENVFISLNALLESKNTTAVKILAAFNNEETGSLTNSGADSTFLTDVIDRINEKLCVSKSEYLRRLASSFVLSVDNAHAMHPNYAAKADIVNRPKLNGGVVLKYNASGKYTTDAVSASVVKELCKRADVPYQEYHNRSDILGGSTLGNIMNSHISVNSADIGLAQLAMHSAYETAGAKDVEYMFRLLRQFYNTTINAKTSSVLGLS